MKKKLFNMLLALAVVAGFTACGDDDDDAPVYTPTLASDGAYIVNSGNLYSSIDGSLTYYNYTTGSASQSVFANTNGRSLGLTANDGVVYGSKVYVVVNGENTIEVFDKKTFTSIKQVKTTDLMGNDNGNGPRHIIAGNGHVFFTTYGGYVAEMDTTDYALTKQWQTGSYPEGLAFNGSNQIIVANSDYGSGNGSVATINLTNDQVTDYHIGGIENPQKIFVTANGEIAVLDWGHYLSESPYTQENAGLKFISFSTPSDTLSSVPATLADYDSETDQFFIINAPYGSSSTEYYTLSASGRTTLNLSETPLSPSAIKVDPVRNYIYILSYNLSEYGYADYSTDGYALIYDLQGNRVKKFDVGVGPTEVFFDTSIKYVLNN